MQAAEPYVFHQTLDGSPTLSHGSSGEWMHHRAGAFSETLYVYGHAMDRAWESFEPSRFCVVGLGLGYVEMMIAANLIRRGKSDAAQLQSFETDSTLRQNLFWWLTQGPQLPPEFGAAYETVLDLTARHFDVPPEKIRECLRRWLWSGSWNLEPGLSASSVFPISFQMISYDPYSAETNPELWESDFLRVFLDQAAASRSIFASYAATGDLKRALQKSGFLVENRPGYSGKRECTLATRPR